MTQDKDEYYILFKDWSLNADQWGMVMDGTAVILTLLGFIVAFVLYQVQRKDKASDAHRFFQDSLPGLKESIKQAIEDLREFENSLELDNIVDPVLSVSLNDKFLEKVDLVALTRYYKHNEKGRANNFHKLLVDSNFFGDYREYITNEIKYFRTVYLEREDRGSASAVNMKEKIKVVLEKDINRFDSILENLESLLKNSHKY